MLYQIKGLHHVTSMASSPSRNNRFFTQTLGLRRVKKTVNFDRPDVYHLYYGDQTGAPGTVMTYFPFPDAERGQAGVGEVGRTVFSVPFGSLDAWVERLEMNGAAGLHRETRFGEQRLSFYGPDGDRFSLVEAEDARKPYTRGGVPAAMAIRGFHSAELHLSDEAPEAKLLTFMGYKEVVREGNVTRFALSDGDNATLIDIVCDPDGARASQGAGSVHHIAFSVDNRARQLEVREALAEAGYEVTDVRDRDYFWAIYFRTPGGILFEVATNEPGFDADEDKAHLGEALKLPSQHAHLRRKLERVLEPIDP